MRSWLLAARKAIGYTQREVALAAGITQPSYSNIEKGERRPSPETAQALGTVLGFDWTKFFQANNVSDKPSND